MLVLTDYVKKTAAVYRCDGISNDGIRITIELFSIVPSLRFLLFPALWRVAHYFGSLLCRRPAGKNPRCRSEASSCSVAVAARVLSVLLPVCSGVDLVRKVGGTWNGRSGCELKVGDKVYISEVLRVPS